MGMLQTWRWYGPKDPVSLWDIKQAGATGIVSALHHVPIGEVWEMEELKKYKRMIEWDDTQNPPVKTGLIWNVIESIPVHESIKQGKPDRDEWIEKYKQSLKNVGELGGVDTICYNFMPVVDWTRTNLAKKLDDGALALEFDIIEFVAFDVFMLKRKGAEEEYTKEQLKAAEEKFNNMTEDHKALLQKNVIAGLPGGQEGYSIEQFKEKLAEYDNISTEKYRDNLTYFLQEILPVAEASGLKMAIHPDDPPFSLFGLPRIVSTESDIAYILSVYDTVYNGYTMCTGSLGVRADNDLVGMVQRYGSRLHFAHLRSTLRDNKGSFHEASHLKGDVDMYNVVLSILKEQKRRASANIVDYQIPMRADHGHTMLDDLKKVVNPGYSAIGLLKGTAELRGLEMGIEKSGMV